MPRRKPTPRAAAMAHGGAGSDALESDGCQRAVDAALAALEAGEDALEAALAAVVLLEDDPRFNAGTGSRVRLDGETVQMDAALMRSDGAFGAVAAIERVRNPVRVARAVLDGPHCIIAGDGATRLARGLGLPDYDPTTESSLAVRGRIAEALRAGQDEALPSDAGWRGFDWRRHWNYARSLEDAGLDRREVGSDTVGAVVRDGGGRFAAALSTGGTALTLRGRVGDVPVPGAGLYAGDGGAAAATGNGELILEDGLARRVHGWLRDGVGAAEAARRAVRRLRARGDIGILVLGRDDFGAAAHPGMAWAAREAESAVWHGPERWLRAS